jgi:UDP-glucose 4-epimerase
VRTLVTGGAGFIGSNLVDALLARGHEVLVIDDFSTGKHANLDAARAKGVLVNTLDIREGEALAEAAHEYAAEVIFHLAAQMDVRRSLRDPAFDARTNVEGTINVLEAARAVNARVINVSSGGAIYGETDLLPTPEDVEPVPEAPYGLSKFCAEQYLRLFARLYGLRGVTARPGNVYGPRQDPLGEAGVIAIFGGLAVQGLAPTVYGSGRQTRDYIYVDDVVDGLLSLLERPHAEGAYNLGTGRGSSVLDIVEAIRPHVATNFEPRFAQARPGEIEHSSLEAGRARRDLDWRARVELGDGLGRTLAWTRQVEGTRSL